MSPTVIESVEFGNDVDGGWVKVNGWVIITGVKTSIAANVAQNLKNLSSYVKASDVKTSPSEFRRLRLWHWQQRGLNRQLEACELEIAKLAISAEVQIQAKRRAETYRHQADMHLSAVQTLNDAPGCEGTTAEQDEAAWQTKLEAHRDRRFP